MPVIFLFLLFIIITIHVSISKSKNIKYNLKNIDSIPYKLLLKKENIKSSACMATFNKNNIKGYNFTKADLFFFENAFLIAGHFSFFKQKIYTTIIIITKKGDIYRQFFPFAIITDYKQFNPNSFNGDVYIGYGKMAFNSVHVTLRLKGVSDEEKKLISFE